MSELKKTNVDDFFSELEAGNFKEKFSHMVSEAALGAVLHGNGSRKGKVTLDLTFAVVGENSQVIISSKLSHSTLTKRGKRSEETVNDTPMFVGRGGVLTIDQPKEEYDGQFSLSAIKK